MPFLLVAALAGCAPALQFGPDVSPDEIPGLEARLSASPASVPVLVRLGQAYRAADRPADALAVLGRAVELAPTDPGAVANLGLAYEGAHRPADARDLYLAYREVGDSPALLRWIEGRLPVLRRQELAREVREAVGRERELAAAPPRPRHVAVFPFLYLGDDPAFQPLTRALAEFLVTDLSQTDRITVLERLRVQLLVEEMELADRGVLDPATAARTGRLLGAEHAVLGTIAATATDVSLEAAVVQVAEASRLGETVREEGALRQLYQAQKRLALELYRGLGIALTPTERERVLRHRTESLEALLAFGRGLVAEDRGDFATAAAEYRQAAAQDPAFLDAQSRAETAEVVAEAEAGPPVEAVAAVPPPAALDELIILIPDPQARDAVAEAMGQEGLAVRRAILDILIRRP